jgi:tetratricopeptide (TPR) repeat protein
VVSPVPSRPLKCPLAGIVFLLMLGVSFAQTDVESLFIKARAEEKDHNFTAAEATYRSILAKQSENLEAYKRLGIVQQTELEFDDSIQSFQRVLRENPKYSQVNFFLGVSFYGKNDFPKAIASLKEELKTAQPHPRTRFYLATLLENSGKPEEAIQQLNLCLSEKPDDQEALYQLARLHKSASFRAMDRLKTLDSDSYYVHMLLGELYSDEDHYPEAIKEYSAALEKRPGTQGVRFLMGVAYWSEHQYQDAEREFRAAFEENPGDGMTNLYLADIAVHDGRFGVALPYLGVAQKVLPGMSQVHLLLGRCFQGQNDLDKAKSEYIAAIQANPAAAQPHYLLAQVYRRLNDSTASASEIAKYEELSKAEVNKTPSRNEIGSDK